jgi:hypothetical protein
MIEAVGIIAALIVAAMIGAGVWMKIQNDRAFRKRMKGYAAVSDAHGGGP